MHSSTMSEPGQPTDEQIEAAAKVICEWIGYDWDSMRDQDISGRYPDWCQSGMQGGRPALRRVARRAIKAGTK